MMGQPFSEAEFQKFTDSLFGTPKPGKGKSEPSKLAVTTYTNRNGVLMTLLKADTQASTMRRGKPTKWTAFQAVSEYVDWAQPVRGGDEMERRTTRMVMDTTSDIKFDALALLRR